MSKDKELSAEEIVQEIINWEWNDMVVEQGDREKLPQMIRDYASQKCNEQRDVFKKYALKADPNFVSLHYDNIWKDIQDNEQGKR